MATYQYSKEIADAVHAYLTSDEWHFEFDDERGLFRFSLNLKGNLKRVNYFIDIKEASYVVYAISSVGVDVNDPQAMAAMAEFICRANYGILDGNFELDMNDGEIRYKSFVNCTNTIPNTEIIRQSIYLPGMMFSRYGSGIASILFAGATPEEAIKKCESNSD